MAWIETYETRDGTSYKVVWNVPRSMVPAGKKSHKEHVTVYDHSHALTVKQIAEDARHALRGDNAATILEERLRPRVGITVAQWAEIFLELKSGEIRTSTLKTYRNQLHDVILPELGDLQLSGLTGLDIKRFLQKTKRERDIKNKTCDRYFAVIKHMCEVAIAHGKLPANPATVAGWKLNKPDAGKIRDEHPERFFEPDQYRLLLDQFRSDFRLFVRFLAETGARFSEVTNLVMSDLDFEHSSARIRFILNDDNEAELPKSGKKRNIEVPEDIMRELHARAAQRKEDDLVFTSSLGKMIDNPNFRRDHWNPAMIRLRQCSRHLPERIDGRNGLSVYDPHRPSTCACLGPMTWTTYTPHALRHSYATWMLRKGRSITLVSKQLGHSSTKVTEETYAHLEGWWRQDREARLSNTLKEVLGENGQRSSL